MANTTTQFTIKINGKNQLVDLNDLLQTNVRSLGDLKEQQDLLQQAFDQADYGTAAFNKLQSSLRDVNSQIKTVDESVEGLTFDEKLQGAAQAIGAVGSAFAFASISVQAFGDENSKTAEELQKLETQIMAIQQGFTAFSELTSTFTKKDGLFKQVLNTLSKGFNAVNISAKGAGLALRSVLVATGIGILVAAVSALIVNFEELKSLAAPLIQAFQPLFDGIRNFASFITFGLIDNAATARLNNQIESISESITKTQENTSKKLEAINTEFELKQVSNLQKAQAVVSTLQDELNQVKDANTNILGKIISTKDIQDFEDNTQKFLSAFASTGTFSKDIGKLSSDVKTYLLEQNRLRSVLADNIKRGKITPKDITDFETGFKNTIKGLTPLVDEFNKETRLFGGFNLGGESLKGLNALNDFYDTIIPKEKQLPIIATNLNKQIQIQNELTKAGITEQDVKNAALLEEAQITKQIADLNTQISLEQEKRSKTNNDLLKQGIDLILSFGNALRSPEFTQDLPVFENFKDQLKFISANLGGDFTKIFDDILTKSSDAIVDVTTLTEAVKKYTDEQVRLAKLEGQGRIDVLKAEIALNDEIFKQQTSQKAKDVLTAKNNLLRQQIKSIEAEVKNTIVNIELATTQLIQSIPRTIEAAKFEEQSRQLEKAKLAFQDYKNGLQLSTEQVSLLFEKLGVDGKVAYETLTKEAKTALDSNVTENLVKQLTLLKEQAKQLAVLFPELKDTVNQYNDAIDGVIRSQKQSNKETTDTIKLLQEELALLNKSEEIRRLQNLADNPKAPLKARIDAINQLNAIELKNIENKFKAETKGLEKYDAAYQIAIINRNKSEEELGKETNDKILAIQIARQQAIIDNVDQSIQNIGNSFNQILQAVSEANAVEIAALQEAANLINEQISQTQEQISFLDELINERKSIIKELEAAAAEATGAQRQEILAQIESEAEATKLLVEEKNNQKKAEQELQRQLTINAKEQAKIEKENQKLAAASAVANQILAVSTAAVAVAKAFNPDPVSSNLPLGVGLAIRAAAAIGFAASLAGLLSSINSLVKIDAQGGYVKDAPYKKRAEGGYTGSSTLRPDETGERPMYHTVQLHEQEWVAPRWMTQSPKYGSLINELEQTRVRGFADGGSIAPLSTQSISNEQLTGLLVANLNRPVYVAVTDINDGQSRVQVIENRGKL